MRFFKKIQLIGFLNPKESENGFCVSLLERSIQGLSDHGGSKEPKNPLWKWILRFLLTRHDPKDLGVFCLVTKRRIHFRKKRTLSYINE